jgi:hypothetical protein
VSTREVSKLALGALVEAAHPLDPKGANVAAGTRGVVFVHAYTHGPEDGPIVRWMTGGCCNIYDGDVKLVVS